MCSLAAGQVHKAVEEKDAAAVYDPPPPLGDSPLGFDDVS
jgi:hypothetical protein